MSSNKPAPRTGTGTTAATWKGKPKAADCAQVTRDNVMMIKQPSKGWGISRLIARAKQRP